MGWLEKCVSYKDKVAQGLPADCGVGVEQPVQYSHGRESSKPFWHLVADA